MRTAEDSGDSVQVGVPVIRNCTVSQEARTSDAINLIPGHAYQKDADSQTECCIQVDVPEGILLSKFIIQIIQLDIYNAIFQIL